MNFKYLGKCLLIEEKRKKILVIVDLYFGFEEVLNRSGVFIGKKMFNEIIKDFDEIFDRIGKVDVIILLGDVKHNFGKNNNQEWDEIKKFFEYLEIKNKKIIIVKGNHDNYLKNIIFDKKNLVWG